MALSKLLRIPEAAELLGLQPSTIRKMVLQRAITVVRPTRRSVRIPEEEVVRIQREGRSPRREEGQ